MRNDTKGVRPLNDMDYTRKFSVSLNKDEEIRTILSSVSTVYTQRKRFYIQVI